MPELFELIPDPRCLRGLRYWLVLPQPGPDRDQLHAALVGALPDVVVGVERWGPGTSVDRLIVQFRVELRIGERPNQLVILFRSCCPGPERERLRALVLATVAGLYDESADSTAD